MDLNWIRNPKEIKQEEPVEYFLISTVSGEELNVDVDTHSNGENFAVRNAKFFRFLSHLNSPTK